MDNVRVLPRTTAFGYYAQNFVGLVERVTDHQAAPDPECRVNGCGRCAPSA
jgi:sarcosine oxidase subunit alpha